MKNHLLTLLTLLICSWTYAQNKEDETSNITETLSRTTKGNWIIEVNTGFGTTGNTGVSFSNSNDNSYYNFALETGYFVTDNLAVKTGFGFGGQDVQDNSFYTLSYKLGAKYYIKGKVPVSLDYNGRKIEDVSEQFQYLGLGAGYAIYVAQNLSIEPGIRYDVTLNDKATEENNLQANIGFVLHF